jgi:F-type H+-transporting ATPase subunit b
MQIDWFVFLAQIINFLILVYLLKYFLYNRILGAMDAREAKIASRFEEAERLRAEAQDQVQAYEVKNRELQEKTGEFLSQAHQAAEAERIRLMDQVRIEVAQARERWYETLGREKKAFLEELRRRAGKYIYDTIRHVLADMADEELETRMVQSFARLIRGMSPDQQDKLRDSLKTKKTVITIRSAFALNPEQRQAIEDAVNPFLTRKADVRYEIAGDIGAGVEMMARGYKLSWSIRDYLASLEEKFVRTLKEEIRPGLSG